jgi:hypothetical protein
MGKNSQLSMLEWCFSFVVFFPPRKSVEYSLFSKNNCQKNKNKIQKITMFLHIVQASSQDIKGFYKFLLPLLVYSETWLLTL